MYPTPEKAAPIDSIIDTHAHFNDPKFDEYRDELLSSLPSLGVGKVINCGCSDETSLDCIALAEKYPYVYAAVGYHPCSVTGDINIAVIEKMLSHEKVVAVGEIGLDYYWDKTYITEQKAAFREQLTLAAKHNLPVIIHDRDAHADTMEIIREYRPNGVFHCFSGSVETARELVKMGMYLGVGGVLTFKNSRKLKEVAADIPLEYILLETDSPYLSPEPKRGKTNNSSLIIYVAEALAEIKGISVDEVLRTTKHNAEKLFNFK
ncbi:MAG: TatD family hydrolase [Clostridia bacterium]|nr:TatD family hydrolase [Clostridia bacterium]